MSEAGPHSWAAREAGLPRPPPGCGAMSGSYGPGQEGFYGSAPHTPADGGAALQSADLHNSRSIRALIQTKEQELQQINEYRIRMLEDAAQEKVWPRRKGRRRLLADPALLRAQDKELAAAKEKMAKLKEDFRYNLKVRGLSRW